MQPGATWYNGGVRIGVISDTHIPSRAEGIPPAVFDAFAGVQLILHAGDVSVRAALTELARIAPVRAVAGNVDDADLTASLPDVLRFNAGGVEIGMIHNSGPTEGRAARMRRRFPGCRVVVFGHSHQPVAEDRDGVLLLNPGSACDPRRAKVPSVAILEVGGEPGGDPSAEPGRRARAEPGREPGGRATAEPGRELSAELIWLPAGSSR
ncbi:MAG TPA: metallophosphoesterase family protein [Actinomycetota bacterium]|nr:metallophosphoesterase family protein [Actinomycetota bacterium]